MLEVARLEVMREGRVLCGPASFSVARGERLALVGPNGAGKSSLFKGITGEWASRGEIRINGRARADWARRELARSMAVMPQQSTLGFDFLVEEVIALGRLPHIALGQPDRDRAAIDHVCTLLDLAPFRARPYLTLSGGERQRVQLARALAQLGAAPESALLLLDEPTSALDLAQAQSALTAVSRYAGQGAAVVMVLHDLSLAAAFADKVLVLGQGKVLDYGTPQELFSAERIAAWFGCPVRVESGGRMPPLIGPAICRPPV